MLSAITLVALLLQPSQTASQPPLAGTWTGDAGRLTIVLTKDVLTITNGSQSPVTLKVDGSVSENVTKTAAGADWRNRSIAQWVGNAVLVVTTTTRETGATWQWLSVYSLEPATGNLNVVTVDYGHEGSDGMVTRIAVYRRSRG